MTRRWCPIDGTRSIGGVAGGRWQERKEARGDQLRKHKLSTCHLPGTAGHKGQGCLRPDTKITDCILDALGGPTRPPWGVETVSRRAAQDGDGRCSHSLRKPQWVVCALRREASQGQTQGKVCVREVSGVGKVKAGSRGQSAWRRGLQEGGGSALAL